MVKGNSHGDEENKVGRQNGQNKGRRFLCAGIAGQEGSGGVSQNEQTGSSRSRHQGGPGNKIPGNDAQEGSGQVGDHAVSIIADPFRQSQCLKRHASGAQPKDRWNSKDKSNQETPSVQEVVNVVFKVFDFTGVTKVCRPVGSGSNQQDQDKGNPDGSVQVGSLQFGRRGGLDAQLGILGPHDLVSEVLGLVEVRHGGDHADANVFGIDVEIPLVGFQSHAGQAQSPPGRGSRGGRGWIHGAGHSLAGIDAVGGGWLRELGLSGLLRHCELRLSLGLLEGISARV